MLVKAGTRVKTGDALAVMGMTGNAATTYPHCHVEARATATGKGLDPRCYTGCANAPGIYMASVAEVKTPSGYGIDISQWQNTITDAQWKDIQAKCDFVLLRFGYRGYSSGLLKQDEQFSRNFAKCKKLSIPIGVYFFTQAVNAAEGAEEAALLVSALQVQDIPLFVACDTELAKNGEGRADNLSVPDRTAAVNAFCGAMQAAGFPTAIYASTSWLNTKLEMDSLPYDVWVADYRGYCGYKGDRVIMWQTDSKNSLGVTGFATLDCNVAYKEFARSKPAADGAPLVYLTIGPMSAGDRITMTQQAETLGLPVEVKEVV